VQRSVQYASPWSNTQSLLSHVVDAITQRSVPKQPAAHDVPRSVARFGGGTFSSGGFGAEGVALATLVGELEAGVSLHAVPQIDPRSGTPSKKNVCFTCGA